MLGTIQQRHGARLAFESLPEFCLLRFDDDHAVETCVAGGEDLPHAARTDERKNLVGPQAHSGSQGHGVRNDCTARDEARPSTLFTARPVSLSGGIAMHRCTWAGIRCLSMIWHSFCRASAWKIAPRCRDRKSTRLNSSHLGISY